MYKHNNLNLSLDDKQYMKRVCEIYSWVEASGMKQNKEQESTEEEVKKIANDLEEISSWSEKDFEMLALGDKYLKRKKGSNFKDENLYDLERYFDITEANCLTTTMLPEEAGFDKVVEYFTVNKDSKNLKDIFNALPGHIQVPLYEVLCNEIGDHNCLQGMGMRFKIDLGAEAILDQQQSPEKFYLLAIKYLKPDRKLDVQDYEKKIEWYKKEFSRSSNVKSAQELGLQEYFQDYEDIKERCNLGLK